MHVSLPCGENPSCLQATAASEPLQKSSHTVPQALLLQTSTRPSFALEPFTSRISPVVHPIKMQIILHSEEDNLVHNTPGPTNVLNIAATKTPSTTHEQEDLITLVKAQLRLEVRGEESYQSEYIICTSHTEDNHSPGVSLRRQMTPASSL